MHLEGGEGGVVETGGRELMDRSVSGFANGRLRESQFQLIMIQLIHPT